MFAQRIGWLSLVAGGVLALGLSLSSVAWAQKGGPPPKPAKTFIESRSNSLSQDGGPPSTQKVGDPVGSVDVGLGKKPGGERFTTTTDNNGAFSFADLEPGTYEVVSLSGFPVAAGKAERYSVEFVTGWTVPVPDTGGGGQKERKSKDYNSIKSNTSSLAAGGGEVLPTEKYSTTKSNIKNMAFFVLPDGTGKLTERVEMEIHAVGSEIMISGPGTGVVESPGAKPGEEGYAITEQGIKRVMPFKVAAPMWLRGRVSVSKATTGLGDPATGVAPATDDVPADIKLPKRFKLKLP